MFVNSLIRIKNPSFNPVEVKESIRRLYFTAQPTELSIRPTNVCNY